MPFRGESTGQPGPKFWSTSPSNSAIPNITMSSTQRVTIKSIEVVIKVTYRGHLDAYMAMAFVKIVIYVLRCVDLRHVELQWSLHLEDAHALAWHPTPSPSPVLMNVAGKDIYLTSIHTLSVEDMSVLTTEIKATDKILATPSTARLYEQESSRWKVYVTIYALCTSLRSLGFASPGVVEEGFIDYDDGGWGDSPIVCPMIYAAQRALANRNDEYLAYMLDGVKSVWKEFTEPLPSVIEQIDGAGSIFDIAKTLPAARLTREQKNKWPAPLAAQIYNDDHAVVVDFVFERHVVDGKISQRLITPSIVSSSKAMPVFRFWRLTTTTTGGGTSSSAVYGTRFSYNELVIGKPARKSDGSACRRQYGKCWRETEQGMRCRRRRGLGIFLQ